MTLKILGISCYYHDAAACLMSDGALVAAAQEERFTRVKNTAVFPLQAINSCLEIGGCTVNDLSAIVFYEKPFLKLSRVLEDHLHAYPFSLHHFLRTMPEWLQDRLAVPQVVRREVGYEGPVYFVPHHMAHASSVFYPSPFPRAAILTVDGVGEWATATIARGDGTAVRILQEMRYPHSLGLVYTAITTYLGFAAHEGEGKVMGLAAYGQPRYLSALTAIAPFSDDGSVRVDESYFGFNAGRHMFSGRFVDLFGPSRAPEEPISERQCDIASSLQRYTEEVLLRMARHAHAVTGLQDLCLSGGVALNCVANSRIREETPFTRVFVQPAPGDAGGALGAAAFGHHVVQRGARMAPMTHAAWGPSFSSSAIRVAIAASGLQGVCLAYDAMIDRVADCLSRDRTVGWFQGGMEFGPRALGNRSILASPRSPDMKQVLNLTVKHREPFRPFAPVVLADRVSEYFEHDGDSPFMLFSPRVRQGKIADIPAVTHVDGTARLQTVTPEENERLYDLIAAFGRRTGVPVLLNTSFNVRGEPLVCTPRDALRCFTSTGLDCLVMGDWYVEK